MATTQPTRRSDDLIGQPIGTGRRDFARWLAVGAATALGGGVVTGRA